MKWLLMTSKQERLKLLLDLIHSKMLEHANNENTAHGEFG